MEVAHTPKTTKLKTRPVPHVLQLVFQLMCISDTLPLLLQQFIRNKIKQVITLTSTLLSGAEPGNIVPTTHTCNKMTSNYYCPYQHQTEQTLE